MLLSELAKIVNGKLYGQDTKASAFNIDTRELLPGEVFIALKGDKHDGHHFLQAACEKQAAGAIVSAFTEMPIPFVQVEDTQYALGQIAAKHRLRYSLPIIAITGSCGKTTTKSMITSILHHVGPTLSTVRSFNNEVGVPLTLLQLNENHRYAVIEMGARHVNDIAYLSQIAQHSVALITNVAPAHLEGFGSIEGVAKAKAEIYEGLPKEGIAILNADDPFVSMWKTIVKDKTTVTFGLNQPADFTASNIKLSAQGQPQFDVNSPKGTFTIRLPLLGEHNVKNALAAIACSYALGVDEEAIIKGLEDLLPVNNRLVRYKGLSGSLVIDDSYNANPLSVTAALKTLATFKGEKIFVFGDMAELGPDQEKFHTEVGNQAKALGIDKLYACGKLSALAVLAFGDKGVFFEDQESLTHSLKQDLHDNATVLVKGSRISQMENIVQAIIQEI